MYRATGLIAGPDKPPVIFFIFGFLVFILNKKINVPIISETGEEKILIKIVMKIDRFLYDNLPNEFYDLVRSSNKGIDDDEAKRLIVRLSKLANQHVDIPYIPEQMEYIAIRFIIKTIINAARKQWDINIAQNASDQKLDAVVLQV